MENWLYVTISIGVYFTSFESTVGFIAICRDGYGFKGTGLMGMSAPSLHIESTDSMTMTYQCYVYHREHLTNTTGTRPVVAPWNLILMGCTSTCTICTLMLNIGFNFEVLICYTSDLIYTCIKIHVH